MLYQSATSMLESVDQGRAFSPRQPQMDGWEELTREMSQASEAPVQVTLLSKALHGAKARPAPLPRDRLSDDAFYKVVVYEKNSLRALGSVDLNPQACRRLLDFKWSDIKDRS